MNENLSKKIENLFKQLQTYVKYPFKYDARPLIQTLNSIPYIPIHLLYAYYHKIFCWKNTDFSYYSNTTFSFYFFFFAFSTTELFVHYSSSYTFIYIKFLYSLYIYIFTTFIAYKNLSIETSFKIASECIIQHLRFFVTFVCLGRGLNDDMVNIE